MYFLKIQYLKSVEFQQEHFTCIRPADWAGNCSDTEKFIDLNKQFGQSASETEEKNETDSESSSYSETSVSSSQSSSFTNSAESSSFTNSAESSSFSNSAQSSAIKNPVEKAYSVDSEQALPESESQSYGLFNVQDPLLLRSDSDGTFQEETAQNNEDDSVVPTESVNDDLAFNVPTTTEGSSDHSTDIWNMYTESLYDGSTIDDIVEVNAVGLQNIEGTTESIESVDK